MCPQVGVYSAAEAAAAIAAHAAALDAHTRNIFQVMRLGDNYHALATGVHDPSTTSALSADRLYARPLHVPRTLTIDRIAVHVTGEVAGSGVRVGIYEDGTNLYPGALLLDAGAIVTTSTGLKTATVDQQLSKGLYWIAILTSHNQTLRAAFIGPEVLGLGPTDLSYYWGFWFKTGVTYGALPDPFPSDAVPQTQPVALAAVRIASLD